MKRITALCLISIISVLLSGCNAYKTTTSRLAQRSNGKFLISYRMKTRFAIVRTTEQSGKQIPPSYRQRNAASDDSLAKLERILEVSNSVTSDSYDPSKSSEPPTLSEINLAIPTAARLNRPDDALRLFASIRAFGHHHDLMSYNNVIWCMGRAGRLEIAKRLFTELCSHKYLKPNVYTYGALLYGLAKSKLYQEALYYLEDMERRGVQPNHVVLSSAMEACAAAGQHVEALGVMEKAKALQMKPDVTMVNIAVKACTQAGEMAEATRLADTLRVEGAMDVRTYHTLMMGHTKLLQHLGVLQLYDEALASSIPLDGGVFSLAMLAAQHSQQPSLVSAIAAQARAVGVRLTEASYTVLIQALGEQGQCADAVACLDTMRRDGLTPNAITYTALLASCRSQPSLVPPLLQRLRREKGLASTIVLTSAISTLVHGDEDCRRRALQLYEEMESTGPAPNMFTYNSIIGVFAELGNLEEALSLLGRMERRGLQPDRVTFTALLGACGGANSTRTVEAVMELMHRAGVEPDLIAYSAALDAHRRGNNSLSAVALLQEMRARHLQPSAGHYNLVLRTLRAEGHLDKMFKMVMSLTSQPDVRLNGNTFEIVLEALLEHARWKEALLLVQTMDRAGHQPSLGVCVVLVEQLERAREYRAALALYTYMERKGYDFYEHTVLNGVFKRLVKMAALGVPAGGLGESVTGINLEGGGTDGELSLGAQ